jgi:anti-sigma factor RsiW
VVAAREHLASCAECRRFLESMQQLGAAIREAAPREYAPPAVRQRLLAVVSGNRAAASSWRARGGGGRTRPLVAAAAVAVLAIGALAVSRQLRRAEPDTLAVLVRDHALMRQDMRVESDDPVVVEAWLARRLDFAVLVPRLPDARLRGARLAFLDGRRGVAMEYAIADAQLSYFVVPDSAYTGDVTAAPRFTRRAGFAVLSWREPGLLHAMVGDFPRARLAVFVQACMEQARRVTALPRHPERSREG